jgi:hypothetical protein
LASHFSAFFLRWLLPAIEFRPKESRMLYLTGVLALAALVYLGYVMIFPEKF